MVVDAQGEQKKGVRGGGVTLQVRWREQAQKHLWRQSEGVQVTGTRGGSGGQCGEYRCGESSVVNGSQWNRLQLRAEHGQRDRAEGVWSESSQR